MSLNSVPKMPAGKLVYGSPKKNGAGEFDQLESSNAGCRQASAGVEASEKPLKNFQVAFDCTSTTRVSSVKLQVAVALLPTKAFGNSAWSEMSWLVAQLMVTVPTGGCDTLKT